MISDAIKERIAFLKLYFSFSCAICLAFVSWVINNGIADQKQMTIYVIMAIISFCIAVYIHLMAEDLIKFLKKLKK